MDLTSRIDQEEPADKVYLHFQLASEYNIEVKIKADGNEVNVAP